MMTDQDPTKPTVQQMADLNHVSRRMVFYAGAINRYGSPLVNQLVEGGKCPLYIAAAFVKLFPNHAEQDEVAGGEDGVREMRFYVKVCKNPRSPESAVTTLKKLWVFSSPDAQRAILEWMEDREPDDEEDD